MSKSGNYFVYLHPENRKEFVMTTFIGDYSCNIDAKGRVLFPAAFKKQLSPEAQERFVVKKDIFEKCLVIFPMDEWQRQVKILRSKINPYKREHNKLLRGFYKDSVEVGLDNNGRLLIPKRLLELAEINKNAMLAGQDGKIEVWSKPAYESIFTDDEDDFAALAEKVMGGSYNNPDEE